MKIYNSLVFPNVLNYANNFDCFEEAGVFYIPGFDTLLILREGLLIADLVSSGKNGLGHLNMVLFSRKIFLAFLMQFYWKFLKKDF